MPLVKVGDINLYYEIRGEGHQLLFINGLAAEISEFGRVIDQLAVRHEVIAFDNRGAGRTDKPDIPYTIEMMAEDTAGLLTALNVNRVDVVGISLGGRIALQLALSHPEMVKRLVLVSTSARVVRSLRSRLIFGALHRLSMLRGSQPRFAFDRQKDASGEFDCTDRLSEIKAETLILAGKKDRFAALGLQCALHAGIRGSEMQIFKGGHLFFMMSERKKFIDSVDDWFDKKIAGNAGPPA